jgi:drug/metabolite transporter (DMT)-like permease
VTGPTARRTALLTCATLTCFAANSLLCRLALGPRAIDAASFTAVRVAAGAAALALLVRLDPAARQARGAGSWGSAAALFAYAILFSLAYLRIGAGVGALILFGAVQATMIGGGLLKRERPGAAEWLGLAVALAGLVVLTAPGRQAPDALGAASMGAAGIAWGVYSLRGRGVQSPLAATAGNFARSVPFAAAALAIGASQMHAAPRGILLAVASGAVASGMGYTIWYEALRGLSATRAAIVQLAVPVLAAAAAVPLLGERITLRLVGAGALVLGGIALAILARRSRV